RRFHRRQSPGTGTNYQQIDPCDAPTPSPPPQTAPLHPTGAHPNPPPHLPSPISHLPSPISPAPCSLLPAPCFPR
ncbi:MAG TPA: hypothetical protein EYH32_02870, partial [Anaerolineae bacterium]|nr:hypothetical protein [Anaerolineae bacterium]